MKCTLTIKGDAASMFKAMQGTMSAAATGAMKVVAAGAKDDIRHDVASEFKKTPAAGRRNGQNFLKTFQDRVYPDRKGKTSLTPAALIFGKAAFVGVFEDGPIVISGSKRLAIPLPAARRLGLDRGKRDDRNTASTYAKASQTDRIKGIFGCDPIVFRKGSKVYLGVPAAAAIKKGIKVPKKGPLPLFLLLPSVTVPKKLHFQETIARWAGKLQEAYDAEVAKRKNR